MQGADGGWEVIAGFVPPYCAGLFPKALLQGKAGVCMRRIAVSWLLIGVPIGVRVPLHTLPTALFPRRRVEFRP